MDATIESFLPRYAAKAAAGEEEETGSAFAVGKDEEHCVQV